MKKIIFILLITNSGYAQQNLVPNGSFEEYTSCPDLTTGYYVDQAKHWFMPTTGTSDYFNVCSGNGLGVPANYIGYQYPRTGNAYGGYYAALQSNQSYYEYISVKLIQPLEKGKKYILTYYLSLADSTYRQPIVLQYVNHTGALISSISYTSTNDLIIPYKPQFVSNPSIFLNYSLDWQKIHGLYTAEGGEEYLTIGYFITFEDVKCNYIMDNGSISYINAYYYIDDVSLMEYEFELPEIPNIITPNGDGANDEFYFDMIGIQRFELIIYNRWGLKVDVLNMENPKWKPKELSDGVYYYTLNITSEMDTQHYKSGFLQILN